MDDALTERVEALERAVTDGDHDLSALADDAEALDRLDALEDRIEDIGERVDELEAATQALRGYVGNIRSVNQDVEQRADTALAKVESLEAEMAGEGTTDCESRTGRSTDVDERPSCPEHRIDDSTSRRQHHRTTTHERESATPDGGLTSTRTKPETPPGEQRCHACGQPRTSDERKRPRYTGDADSLTAQSVFDGGDGVDREGLSAGEVSAGEERADTFGDRERGDDDHADLVPENDPLVSNDDEPGGLRRLRELL